jgi:Cu(I)/Ag(I) efflux system membrane protein CusA/SilA
MKFKIDKHGNFVLNERLQQKTNEPVFFSSEEFQLVNKNNEAFSAEVQEKLLTDFLASSRSFLIEDADGIFFRNWRKQPQKLDSAFGMSGR